MVDKIEKDVVVKLAYRMVVDGEEIENAPADDPLFYLHGTEDGVLVPGLEAALVGKAAGDKLTVTLAPEEAYGEYDDEAVMAADRADFELPHGLGVGDAVEIEDADGDIFEAIITAMDDESITMDMNSEFAGEEVTFEVEVLELREATKEEIVFGEPAEIIALLTEDHDHEE
ncbi:MAG: FKBP-type peptidyl-prolyl cis-trans isomerase [Chloroflexota bacterium]